MVWYEFLNWKQTKQRQLILFIMARNGMKLVGSQDYSLNDGEHSMQMLAYKLPSFAHYF